MKLSDAEHWAIDRENREKPARAARDRTEALLDEIADLETRLAFREVLLESAVELLDRRAAQHARLLELVDVIVRCDEILAADDDRTSLALAA